MKNRVLYFPYIRIPKSTWLTQMLLYWDQVASIVPYEFIQRPGKLGRYMRSLVEEELVFQVIPGQHIYEISNFEGAFQGYLDDLGAEADRRRAQFAEGNTFEIHIEKMGGIGDALVHQKLAKYSRSSWYEVEADTATDFMSYLAIVLGQLPSVDSSPFTDEVAFLERFAHVGVAEDCVDQQLQALRIQVLERVLPVPSDPIEPTAIRAFKNKHAKLLDDFRRRVERELVAAAAINDDTLRQRRLDIFFNESDASIEEIQAAMSGAGWETVKASFKVLAAIPGASQVFGLVAALLDASPERQLTGPSRDFAYAAYARATF